MKIRHLTIRNIASIESAEIDFENDLRDISDGNPSSLFLITGDTGAGKSVILDSISMALYGTTPRVNGVANKTKNSYLSSEGNEIKISDISQYTRLGISSKDPCFVELTFEGNDGKSYVSLFSLGVNRNGKLRNSSWSLRVGKDEVIEGSRKDEIKERIQQAVGLNYEQFCRMAMLAQGQFASFLTGGKEERERILEQLTSTQRFSRYGEAIDRLFKKAKKAKEEAEIAIRTERNHLLPEVEELRLREELSQLEKETENLRKDKNRIEEILRLLSVLLTREEEKEKLSRGLDMLKARESGNDFQLKKNIIREWDATEAERTLLVKKLDTISSLEKTEELYRQHLSHFSILAADLGHRLADMKNDETQLRRLSSLLVPYLPHKGVYENIGIIKEKFTQLNRAMTEREQKNNELQRLSAHSEELKEILAKAEKEAHEAYLALNAEKERIQAMQSRLEILRPQLISEMLSKETARRLFLEKLYDSLRQTEEIAGNMERAIRERAESEAETKDRKAAAENAAMDAERARVRYDRAAKRYDTMHYSVEEGCSNLRNRLIHQKACTCPLCGQHKDWGAEESDFTEVFSAILSPLQEECDRLKHENDSAASRSIEASKAYNESVGKFRIRDNNVAALKTQFDKAAQNLYSALKAETGIEAKAEVPVFDEIRNALTARLEICEKEIVRLTTLKTDADNLQTAINTRLKDCRPLETASSQKEKARVEANNRVIVNKESISGLATQLQALNTLIEKTEEEIDSLVAPVAPEWKSNPEKALVAITTDAAEYGSLLEKEKKLKDEIDGNIKWLESIETIREETASATRLIPDLIPEEQEESEKSRLLKKYATLPRNEMGKAWQKLYGEITSGSRAILSARQEIARAEASLEEYYLETSSDEKHLLSLVKLGMSIKEIRNETEELLKNIASHEQTLETLSQTITILCRSIEEKTGVIGRELFPERSQLEAKKASVDSLLDESQLKIGKAKERLDQNTATRSKVAEALSLLESRQKTFARWDILNRHFGGTRFRTLVQSYILRPLLRNANLYLRRITDRFTLTCSDSNEQLSILVLDRYNKDKIRSATVLSGGERFMISLALSLALSAMNKPGLNVDILFIDEGFGTLDAGSLNAVIDTLRRLPEIAGSCGRRVGVISHREELADCIETQIQVRKCGEGRSRVVIAGNYRD